MSAILEQLGLDQSFFIQLAIFAVLFLMLGHGFFRPFLKLLQNRHQRTVADKAAAEKLMVQAEAKFEEYKKRISDERAEVRKEVEAVLQAARNEETAILNHARDEAKKITQAAADSVAAQREELKKKIEGDVEALAQTISEKLLSRKA